VVAINSHGFRGPELPVEAPERTRIVALGDSVTFGNDLYYNTTWPAELERALRADGRPVDVLDLGLGGYDTSQEVATLEDIGLAFHPVHVIVGFCVNDVGIVSMSMESTFGPEDRRNPLYASRLLQWIHTHSRERAAQRALFERNREESYARVYVDEIDPLSADIDARVAALQKAVVSTPSDDQDLATRRIPPRWFASDARIGRLAHAFARLAALRTASGFDVTILLVPYLEEDPRIEQGFEIVRALAEARGFAVVAPRSEFKAAGLEHLRIRKEDPVHPNALGHQILADALVAPVAASLPERANAAQ
jgi:lysophospholipase L1-like esterase